MLNDALIRALQLSPNLIDRITAREDRELKRRENLYPKGWPPLAVHDPRPFWLMMAWQLGPA
ncbi:MAG TPA: hypothetical protein VLJ11_19410 [Bryobacteraceae bacterium]|nr:hypothetical protein [Bryobacteraceae bacterium]